MLKTIEGIYEDGQIRLTELPREVSDRAQVLVTFLDSSKIAPDKLHQLLDQLETIEKIQQKNSINLLETVKALPDEVLLELANFIDYLHYKSAQPRELVNNSSSFLVSITGLGNSNQEDISEGDGEILRSETFSDPLAQLRNSDFIGCFEDDPDLAEKSEKITRDIITRKETYQ
jgi:hypothetical protein